MPQDRIEECHTLTSRGGTNYKVGKQLGSGTIARTFLATRIAETPSAATDADVVLKVLLDEHRYAPDMRKRLHAEYELLIQLRGPEPQRSLAYVPVPLDLSGDDAPMPWFVMSKARGLPASQLARRGNRFGFPEEVAVAIAVPVLRTFNRAHELGYSYSDWDLSSVFVDDDPPVPQTGSGYHPNSFNGEQWLNGRERVTVIDWNVVHPLPNDPEAKAAQVRDDIRQFFAVWHRLLSGVALVPDVTRDFDTFVDRPELKDELSYWIRVTLARGLGRLPQTFDDFGKVEEEFRQGLKSWGADLKSLEDPVAGEGFFARSRRTGVGRRRHELAGSTVPDALAEKQAGLEGQKAWERVAREVLRRPDSGETRLEDLETRLLSVEEEVRGISPSLLGVRTACRGAHGAAMLLVRSSGANDRVTRWRLAGEILGRLNQAVPPNDFPVGTTSQSDSRGQSASTMESDLTLRDPCLEFVNDCLRLFTNVERVAKHVDAVHASELPGDARTSAQDLKARVQRIRDYKPNTPSTGHRGVTDDAMLVQWVREWLAPAVLTDEANAKLTRLEKRLASQEVMKQFKAALGAVVERARESPTADETGKPSPRIPSLDAGLHDAFTRAWGASDLHHSDQKTVITEFRARSLEVYSAAADSMKRALSDWVARAEAESRARNKAEEEERTRIERDGDIASKLRESQVREAELRTQLEAWRQALREGRLALVVRDGDGSAAEDPVWRRTVTAMADAWVALRDARQNDDERKETDETVNRFLMAFTTIEPLSGAWLRFDHVRAEGKRVGMAVTVPVQAVEGALKNRLDVRWKPLLDRVPKVARELPASELAALGPTVAQEREATLVALAAEVAALRQEFDRWPTLTPLVTVMGPMASQLVTLEKATTQVRALRERQAALRAKWDAAGDDSAAQVAVLDEAAREKVRFYDAPEDLPAALGAQFRQALRITVPAQVPMSATQPRLIGQGTPGSGTRVVLPGTHRQGVGPAGAPANAQVLGNALSPETADAPLGSSTARQGAVPVGAEVGAPTDMAAVQRLVDEIRNFVKSNLLLKIDREAWIAASRQERVLAGGREADPLLAQLNSVRDQLLRVANTNALRWGKEALLEGGSKRGRKVIDEVWTLADEMASVPGAGITEPEPWDEWGKALARREGVETQVEEVRQKVVASVSLRRALEEFDGHLRDKITTYRETDWASDVSAWLTIMRTHLIGTDKAGEAERLRQVVDGRLTGGRGAVPQTEFQTRHSEYLKHVKAKAADMVATLEGRAPGKEMANVADRGQLCAWRRLRDRPGDDWFAAFADDVAKRGGSY